MMRKIDLFYGALIAIAASVIGSWIFIEIATPYGFADGFKIMYSQGKLGKLITLGAILNLVAFFLLLKYKKELMARGVVLGTIILTVVTLFL